MRLMHTRICSIMLLIAFTAMLLLSGCAEKKSGANEEKGEGQLTRIGQDARSVRWSPDGTKLAVVTAKGYLAIYEAANDGMFQLSRYADKKTGYINARSLAWGADGSKIYYYDRLIDEKTNEPAPLEYGTQLTSADLISGKVTNVHPQFIESVSSLDASLEGSKLYMTTYERKKYSIVSFQLKEGLHQDLTKQLAVDPAGGSRLSRDGRWLFVNEHSAEGDRYQGVLIELATGQKRVISDQYLDSASFSPDGLWLAYVGTDHTVFVIPTDQHAGADSIVSSEQGVMALDWSPQGDRIALTAQAEAGSRSAQLYLMEVPQSYRSNAKP
ncbi:TolB-like translocation protein [Paenibacillus kobensis]|uniref:PD40 domain-containing protein n=1 Tax=Paenibacillus kobensis TaxID=59841 RepID=UPI000FDCA8F0|nr:PD40 domain-containing protein [Paenibacillus kobensis]